MLVGFRAHTPWKEAQNLMMDLHNSTQLWRTINKFVELLNLIDEAL